MFLEIKIGKKIISEQLNELFTNLNNPLNFIKVYFLKIGEERNK